ncbi:hypothetical protein ACX80W_03565 [Arthrobacter sp. TMN-37]
MSWWMWLVLWIALVAVSALFLLAVAFRVFRKAVSALNEFEQATAQLAPPPLAAGTEGGSPGAVPAVFADPGEVRRANHEAKLLRRWRRRERRVHRRAEHRRPQLLGDLPHL